MRPAPLTSISTTLLLAACGAASDAAEPATAHETAPMATTAPASSGAPAGPSLPIASVTAPSCGYGGSAPMVAVFLDVHAETALHDVGVTYTLSDAAGGAPFGGPTNGYASLVVVPADHSLTDYSTQGTTPFDGTLAAGTTTRLLYGAGVGESPTGQTPLGALGGPLRVDVTVHAREGTFVASCTTEGMWPSS
ncbi:MAG: hypothetical protein U0234_26795 [Sandaracinus sp.]